MGGISIDTRWLGMLGPAGGLEPLANEDGTVRAVLDGEIYNRPRLRRLLGERGHEMVTGNDAEILAHLYEEYGDDLVYALEGAFAFAVWDQRERRLLIARDRLGEKPLFYATRRVDELSFASEPTALAAVRGPAAELDPFAVDQLFVHGYVPGSMFAGVRQLAPGNLLVWRPGEEPATRRYWAPPAPVATDAETAADVVREFGRLLTASVRSRLIGDAPVGVILGGGSASTLIAAIAARESDAPVKTFAIAFPTGGSESLEGVRETARELGSGHHELVVSPDEIGRGVPAALGALDQPLADPFFPIARTIAGFAREESPIVLDSVGTERLFETPAAPRPVAGAGIYGPRLIAADDGPRALDQVEEPRGPVGSALVTAERAADQVALGIRLPYLDYELAEFAATVASPQGAGGGKLIRSLLSGMVSKGSLRRPKVALKPPTADWLRGPLAPVLRAQLQGSAVTEGWLDATALGQFIDRHENGADHSLVLWPALAFGLWLDRIREGGNGR